MHKFIKILLISTMSLIVLCLVGIACLVIFVKPNSYKPLIIKVVEKTTSRHLTLDGDISWQFYPHIGFKVESVALSNPPSFKESSPFLSASIASSTGFGKRGRPS